MKGAKEIWTVNVGDLKPMVCVVCLVLKLHPLTIDPGNSNLTFFGHGV